MLRSAVIRCTCVFALLVLLSAVSATAQITTGEVTGDVTDSSGAALAGATVTAVCPDTQQTRTITSGSEGEYRLSSMAICVYKVSVSAPGFKTTVRNVTVTVAQSTKADFQLQIGERTETVTVEAATPLVDYSPGVNNDVDTERIVDLPTNGRDFKSILALTPGVQRTPGGGFLDVSISGQRTTANNYLIDGMYNNDRFYGSEVVGQPGVLGVSASVLANDAIAEYTVQQLPSAEYGVKGGASVNVTLKSGTNDYHGSLYYFGHWSAFDASNAISQSVVSLHNHQYGGTIGGPLIKDRTFFFVNFEGQRNLSKVPYGVNVPTQGDLADALAKFSDPATNVNNLPINPAGQALVNFFPINPSPTPGGADQIMTLPNTDKMSSFLVKIDHKVNNKNQLSGRYMFADSLQSAPASGYQMVPPSTAGPADMFNTIAPTRVQMAGATWTYSLAPNKIFDTRFNWTRYSQILDVNNKIDPKSLGIDTGPLDPLDFGVPQVYSYASVGYIGGVVGYPLSTRPTTTFDVSEHFTWIKGTHTMKMGGNYQRASTFSLRNRARTAFNLYETDWTTVLTSLLLGRVDEAVRSFGDTARNLHQPSVGLYWQDEWKMRPRLTLSYGLRWDFNAPLGESNNIASNFFPDRGLVKVGDGISRLYNRDWHNFGPRVGLAWDIFGNGKTALRLGYAMTYDVANFSSISAPYTFHGARAGAFTNSNLGVFSVTDDGNFDTSDGTLFQALGPNTCFNPAVNTAAADFVCLGPQPGNPAFGGSTTTPYQTFGSDPTATPPFNIFGTIPDLRTQRIHYYSATIQHEVFKNSVITVSYIGTRGQNLLFERSLNNRQIGCWDDNNGGQQSGPAGSANNTTSLNCDRPFDSVFTTNVNGTLVPSYNYIMQLNNDGYQRYNALQASFRQRNWHNINTQYNFTWSNCIDNNSTNRGGQAAIPLQTENPYNPHDTQGPCDTDVRLNFNLGGTYTVPNISSMGRLGEGWEIGGVFTALTGRPFTARAGGDTSGQDQAVLRADCIAAPHYDYSQRTFITNISEAFVDPVPGTIGTCGRNTLRGPGFRQFDANVLKTTRLSERFKLQFRWEVFNVLNHPNFSPSPGSANIDSGSFATSETTPDGLNPGVAQGSPRVMQFGLKLLF
jgi:carboxypeptidase family protein